MKRRTAQSEMQSIPWRSLILLGGTIVLFFLLVTHSIAGAQESQEAQNAPLQALDDVSSVPGQARRALFRAQSQWRDGRYAEAADILRESLREHPDQDHHLLRIHLGNCLAQSGKMAEAVVEYQAAANLTPQYVPAWLKLGETAFELERYELAAEAFTNGFRHDPDQPGNVLYYAATAHLMAGQPARAVPLLEDLVSGRFGRPQMDWYRALVSACLELKHPERPEPALEGMLEYYGDDPGAWLLIYQHAVNANDFRRAAVALTITGYLRPLSHSEQEQLGNLYNAIEVPWQAGRLLEEALTDSSSAADFERLASTFLAAHETPKALRIIQQALAREPTVRLYALLGDLHYMNEEYEPSYAAYRQASELDGTYGRAHLMMGYCALKLDRLPDAAASLERALEFPDQAKTAAELLKRVRILMD
jgi:tetratricopeptide (TPR) repeat protein